MPRMKKPKQSYDPNVDDKDHINQFIDYDYDEIDLVESNLKEWIDEDEAALEEYEEQKRVKLAERNEY